MWAFVHSLMERYSGRTWQLVTLISGLVLLLAGLATARFGLSSGSPVVRAAEPHPAQPPMDPERSPTPAPLPDAEKAVPLSAQAPSKGAAIRLSTSGRTQDTIPPEPRPTLAGGIPSAANVAWNDVNTPMPGESATVEAHNGESIPSGSPWVVPPMPDAGAVQAGQNQSPAPRTELQRPTFAGQPRPNERPAGQDVADGADTLRNPPSETPPAESNPVSGGQSAPPQPLASSQGEITSLGPTQSGNAAPGAPAATPSSPFDALPPPSSGTRQAIEGTTGGLSSIGAPAPIPAATAGAANPLVMADGSGVGTEGDARPGDPALEGPQSPQVSIHKLMPEEVQVGKPALFRIVVRNSGAITIPKVEVHDPIPWGVRVLRTNPSATQGSQGTLVWTLGPLHPGDEAVLEAEVMPLQEGELGSVTTVLVHTQASARTKCTRPQLTVKTQAQPQVMIGDEVLVTMTVSNTGSGVATNVVLEEHVPPELQHPAGNELENVLGDLKPGESRQVQLKLQAIRAGNAVNRLIARADGNLRVEDQTTIQVLAPQLEVTVGGPSRRFLDRETSYQIALVNRGTAPAKNVRLTASLAAGLQFVRTNNAGAYDPTTHSVQWLLAELPVGQTGMVELVVNPIAAGQQELVCSVRDELGISSESRLSVLVEGISALHFQVADTKDPIAVGMETTYEIRVVNQGTKEATNVQVMVTFPEGIRPLAGEGPVPNTVNGNEVLFGKLNRLAPRGEAIFRIRSQAVGPGDQRIRVQILSDDIRLPITKEESTQVYSDSE
ncbi:MAG TPA: hypothetical protein PKI05_02625 [Thermogutta sp.]|nr:hypothetical protein [Thermogutta sp.]